MEDFFVIKDEKYNILYHVPTAKMAKVSKKIDLDGYNDDELYKKFNLEKQCTGLKKLELGKGKTKVVFMASRTCNLGCKYCFAGAGEYGDKDEKPKYMSSELFMKSILYIMKLYKEGIESICFFGGEPLLNFEEIKKFVPQCIEYFENKGFDIPKIAVSTNLTLLNDEMISFFQKYNIMIVSSLDGPQKINDAARVYKSGEASVFEKLSNNFAKLKEHNMDYYLQMVINKNHIDSYKKGEAIKWLEELEGIGYKDLAIVPVETENMNLKIEGKSNLEKLDSIAREITNYYIDKLFKEGEYCISKGIIGALSEVASNKYKRSCQSGHSLFIDSDGDIYPCQLFCTNESYLLGNVYEEKIDKVKSEYIANVDRMNSEFCKKCEARKICMYWCKGIQKQANGDIYKVCEPRCIFQRAIMEECIKALARLKKGTKEYKVFWENIYKLYGVKN